MFLSHTLEERRLGPAPLTLVLTRPPPLLTRLKIVDALPAKLLAEDCALLLQTIMHGAESMWARPLALIVREFQAVIIFDALARSLGGVFRVVIVVPKACSAICVHIFRGLSFDDPLGH